MLNTHTTKVTQMGLCNIEPYKIMPDLPTLTATKLAAEPKQPQNKPLTNHPQHHTFADKQQTTRPQQHFPAISPQQYTPKRQQHPRQDNTQTQTSAQLTKPTATQSQSTRLQKKTNSPHRNKLWHTQQKNKPSRANAQKKLFDPHPCANQQSLPKPGISPKKCCKPSKYSRKKRLRLRMEIFGGTYMRLRYSPCHASRGKRNRGKMRAFWVLRLYLGFIILVMVTKNASFFQIQPFSSKRPQIWRFAFEEA